MIRKTMELNVETVFDPRCGFVSVEAVDQRASYQYRAIEHNLSASLLISPGTRAIQSRPT
jgi:hypothetical protein